MFDFTIHEESRTRYNEMLRDAELARRVNRAKRVRRQSRANPLLIHISDWLIESGSWLKQRNDMRPGLS